MNSLGRQDPSLSQGGATEFVVPLIFLPWGGVLDVQQIGLAVFLFAVAFASIRHRAIPRWLGWPAVVLAVLFLVLPNATIPVILTYLWAIVAGVTLAVQGRPRTSA